MMIRFLILIPPLIFLTPRQVESASLIAGVKDSPETFLLTQGVAPIGTVTLDFQPEGSSQPPEESGWLAGVSSWEGSYHSASWPVAKPDRFDDFSARWRGIWEPGPGDYEFRLRSDGPAEFFVGGQGTLVTAGSASGVTAEVRFEQRPYQLRLDYSHDSGSAFVFLEWRQPGKSWLPLVPTRAAESGPESRWEGVYYQGARFEAERFKRFDGRILWNWGDRGPLNRREDIPTATLKWGQRTDGLPASFQCNRAGKLRLRVEPVPSDASFSVTFDRTVLEVQSLNAEPIRLQFDQPGTFQTGDGIPPIEFDISPDRPLHFWEPQTGLMNGDQVDRFLSEAAERDESNRPRIEGDFAYLDQPALSSARWWLEMLINRNQNRVAMNPSSNAGTSGGLWLDWKNASLSWARTFAPDLLPDLVFAFETENPNDVWALLFDGPAKDFQAFLGALKGEEVADRNVRNPYPEQRVEWEVETLARGLTQWRR
ncbi:MAG: hypothetical protein KC978_21045, partial [Candidatus Omnitrophica bacterium]|nr:hypothetical protein [Candidatus Omnitrophota bacterium]